MLTLLRTVLFEPTRLWRLLAAAGLLVLLGLLFYLGQKPFAVGLLPAPWDKAGHLCLFITVSTLVWVASNRSPWIVLGAAALIGALDEYAQSFAPGREVSVGDWAMDMTGAVITLIAIEVLRRWMARTPVVPAGVATDRG